jgi:hypothetical protein
MVGGVSSEGLGVVGEPVVLALGSRGGKSRVGVGDVVVLR